MEGYKNLIIAVESNQSSSSIEEVDDYKYPQEGSFVTSKQKRNQALSSTKHSFLQPLSLPIFYTSSKIFPNIGIRATTQN